MADLQPSPAHQANGHGTQIVIGHPVQQFRVRRCGLRQARGDIPQRNYLVQKLGMRGHMGRQVIRQSPELFPA